MLASFWDKVHARFADFSKSFRFFARNHENYINFKQFSIGCETLSLKYSSQDLKEIFDYLDKDKNGFITY